MALNNSFHLLTNFITGGFRRRSNNNFYSDPVNIHYNHLNLSKNTEWISIDGKEEEYYNTTAELKIVIDRLALMFSNGVFKVLDQNDEEIENDPIISLLEQPNVRQSRNEFLFQWWVQRALYPSTFTYFNRAFSTATPSAIWNLPPSLIKIERTGKIWQQVDMNEIISQYELCYRDGEKEIFTTDDIMQIAMPSSDDPIIGKSPLHAIRMNLSNLRAAMAYRNVILTKRGSLGVWSADGKDSVGSVSLNPKEAEQMEKQLVKNYGIGDHQSSITVSRNPMKFTHASFPTKDLLLFEEVDADKAAIIDLYGANKNMFSMDSSSTFTNVEAAEKNCYQDTIIPTANDFCDSLTKKIGYSDLNKKITLDYSHINVMQEDEEMKSVILERKVKAMKTLIDAGMSQEEARAIVGI